MGNSDPVKEWLVQAVIWHQLYNGLNIVVRTGAGDSRSFEVKACTN